MQVAHLVQRSYVVHCLSETDHAVSYPVGTSYLSFTYIFLFVSLQKEQGCTNTIQILRRSGPRNEIALVLLALQTIVKSVIFKFIFYVDDSGRSSLMSLCSGNLWERGKTNVAAIKFLHQNCRRTAGCCPVSLPSIFYFFFFFFFFLRYKSLQWKIWL